MRTFLLITLSVLLLWGTAQLLPATPSDTLERLCTGWTEQTGATTLCLTRSQELSWNADSTRAVSQTVLLWYVTDGKLTWVTTQ